MKLGFLAALLAFCLLPSAFCLAAAVGTAFTYQGRLTDGGAPASGSYELTFQLWDDPLAGNSVSKLVTNAAVIAGGLFTTPLDFGSGLFEGGGLWLQIGVRTNGSGGAFNPLTPRQPITPTPQAIHAATAGTARTVSEAIPASQVSGTLAWEQLPGAVLTNDAVGVTLTGTFTGSGTGLTGVNAATLGGLGAGAFWQLGGNAITGPDEFLGTTGIQPLELRVNNRPALRLEPAGTSGFVNVIGGAAWNSVAPEVGNATIAGGAANSVRANFGTIGGGGNNTVSNDAYTATIAGGYGNAAFGSQSTIGGGNANSAVGFLSTISGGRYNLTEGAGATVGGGHWNQAAGENSLIGGGESNLVNASHSTVAGGRRNVIHQAADFSAIGGGEFNAILRGAHGASIPGGQNNSVHQPFGFAAGVGATVWHKGAFVWADPRLDETELNYWPFPSVRSNEFALRASGGVRVASDRGVALDDVDGPIITRGWDPFDASAGSAKEGHGRWGLFMEWCALTLGIPGDDLTERSFQVAKYSTNGEPTALMTVDQSGTVTANAFRLSSGLALGTNSLSAPEGSAGLQLQVGNVLGLRLENPSASHVNVIGGVGMNYVEPGVRGATIAGGGLMESEFDWSRNIVASDLGTVGGGGMNVIGLVSTNATIAGGFWNTTLSANGGTIAGGAQNSVMNSQYAAVGGGADNHVGSFSFLADFGTIAGGTGNSVRAAGGFIGGGPRNLIGPNSVNSVIAGGADHVIGTNAQHATVGGGRNNTVEGNSLDNTIAGGYLNRLGQNSGSATIGGGAQNLVHSDSSWAVIPGGFMNEASGVGSFAAGVGARAMHAASLVWSDKRGDGPFTTFSSVRTNEFAIRALGGLRLESARGIAEEASDSPIITRGWDPFDASAGYAKEGHGRWGLFMEPGFLALGMPDNGWGTIRFGKYAVNGAFTSLANVEQDGTFRTAGPVNPPSDRNVKQDFAPVDPRAVLERIAALPVQTWSYTNSTSVRHIGPVAQDFRAAFGLGADDKTIATVDADGVALAAIQGLNQKLEEQLQAKNAELQALKASVAELQDAVRRLSQPSK
ncbi:MAG: tail fiber domain-containing protein [Verrucomicrobia bacterium]|nr:tail fiber domain-containing protein [Verrucomicrobiota bacterium]